MANTDSIAVVIPAYNRAGIIHHTLHSILTQDAAVDEIIVVDDGSQDNIDDVIAKIGSTTHLPVRLLRQQNGGPGRARNAGARAATADYILFLDSDDLLTAGAIDRFRRMIQKHAFPDLVMGGRITKLPHGRVRRTLQSPMQDDRWQNFQDELLGRRSTPGLGSFVVCRKFVLQHPFPESFRIAEDMAFFAVAFFHGRCVSFPEPQVEIDQQTHHAFRDPNALLPELTAAFEFVFKDVPDSDRKWLLQRSLRAEPWLRTFRELHRAGDDQTGRAYYLQALRLHPAAALHLSYLRKFLRGMLGIRHPAARARS